MYAIFVVLFLGALTVASAQSQIMSGKYAASTSSAGYTLDKGSGDRTYTVEISYPTGFDKKPTVVANVSTVDAEKSANVRYSVEVTAVSRDGFIIKITTWGDSKLYGIGGSWIAYSE
jgi:hypothetical protein